MINLLEEVFELPHTTSLGDIWPLWGVFVNIVSMGLWKCTVLRGGEKRGLGPK